MSSTVFSTRLSGRLSEVSSTLIRGHRCGSRTRMFLPQ
nr:MAG TPA: hypothetical protein [Caudoviricetes sp.]